MALGEELDGATLREHYESIWKQTGSMPAELDTPECPPGLRHIWEYFGRVSLRRSFTSEGVPVPVSNQELSAWQALNGVSLSTFEVEVMDGLERVYISHCFKVRMAKMAARAENARRRAR